VADVRHGGAVRVPGRVLPGRVLRSVVILAAVMLLASCLGTSGEGTGGTGTNGTPGTSGNGYGGQGGSADGGQGAPGGSGGAGGTGGDGGDGHGGWGGNGYGGPGGSADGGDGAPGRDGAPGGRGADGADGAPGHSFPYDGPGVVAGSGRLTSRTIDLSGVKSLAVGAGFVVNLKTGGPPQATVKMDDNLVDRVQASVIGAELQLGIRPGMSVRDATLSAEITVSQLDRLATNGASQVVLSPTLTGPALDLVVSGTSAVTGPVTVGRLQATVSGASILALSGQVQDMNLSAAGTSRLPLADLTVGRLDARLSGTSHATVTVSDTLVAEAAGVSMLRYLGAPSVTRSQTSGMSSIVPAS
jgi:Putative auto-transporter adhesin, head GIN domain